jgi:hypothetical protein
LKQIPVYGSQHPTTSGRTRRQDTRYSENVGYSAVLEDEDGQHAADFDICLEADCGFLDQPGSDPIQTTFELNDTLYAKAHIPPTNEVYLWLGVWNSIIRVIAQY